MPCSPTTCATNQEQNQLVGNLEDLSIGLVYLPIPSHTLEPPTLVDPLTLPKLLRKKMYGKEPLLDYSISHVVTLNQCLVQLKQSVATLALGSRPRQKGLQGCGSKRSPRVTLHVPESVGECEGMNPHPPKASPTLGNGVSVDS
jgi:hypothetical protein